MLTFTDIALLTFEDDQDLYGDQHLEECIKRASDAGVTEIVIKRGSDDCLVVEGGEQIYVSPNKVTNVLDTTAAGDSFSAGYLAKRLCGGTSSESAYAGHCVARTIIQYPGAVIPKQARPELYL